MGRTLAAIAIALSATVSAESAEYADIKKFVKENPQLSSQGTLVGRSTTTANSPAARNFRTQPLWGVRMRGRI